MIADDAELMILFLNRQGMYINPVNKENIVSFMHRVDFGMKGKMLWTDLLNDFIVSKYRINGVGKGWPYQIEVYSKKKKISWIKGFIELMFQLIKNSEKISYTEKLKELNKELKSHVEK